RGAAEGEDSGEGLVLGAILAHHGEVGGADEALGIADGHLDRDELDAIEAEVVETIEVDVVDLAVAAHRLAAAVDPRGGAGEAPPEAIGPVGAVAVVDERQL